jgi:hypothetical protein
MHCDFFTARTELLNIIYKRIVFVTLCTSLTWLLTNYFKHAALTYGNYVDIRIKNFFFLIF